MKRLVYTLERTQPAPDAKVVRTVAQDATIGLTMATLGLPGIQRRVNGAANPVEATLVFPDDHSFVQCNLRIERALAVRGVKISKIRFTEEGARRRGEQRAVA